MENKITIFENYTPHTIILNNGMKIPSVGIARVTATFSKFNDDLICHQEFGDIIGLPEPREDTYYIVSTIVLSASKAVGRTDCIAPATGHPECKRE